MLAELQAAAQLGPEDGSPGLVSSWAPPVASAKAEPCAG